MAATIPIFTSHRFQDLTGKRFGRLVALFPQKVANEHQWLCRCDCGKTVLVWGPNLRRGLTRSCGCYKRDLQTTHGLHGSPEYRIWHQIKTRCTKPSATGFHRYGGRGIAMAPEWLNDPQAFIQHIGPRPSPQHSVDRIDNSKGYIPGNVRWATRKVQMRNTRSNHLIEFNGEILTLADWAEKQGLPWHILRARIAKGWPTEIALTAPPGFNDRGLVSNRRFQKLRRAQAAVARALKRGRLVKPGQCQEPGCQQKKVQAHHHKGYSRKHQLDVVWLCPHHHGLKTGAKRRAHCTHKTQ